MTRKVGGRRAIPHDAITLLSELRGDVFDHETCLTMCGGDLVALEASLLLFVVDASEPTWETQLEACCDQVGAAGRAALLARHPDAILLSAHSAEDVNALRGKIIAFFEAAMMEDVLVLP